MFELSQNNFLRCRLTRVPRYTRCMEKVPATESLNVQKLVEIGCLTRGLMRHFVATAFAGCSASCANLSMLVSRRLRLRAWSSLSSSLQLPVIPLVASLLQLGYLFHWKLSYWRTNSSTDQPSTIRKYTTFFNCVVLSQIKSMV